MYIQEETDLFSDIENVSHDRAERTVSVNAAEKITAVNVPDFHSIDVCNLSDEEREKAIDNMDKPELFRAFDKSEGKVHKKTREGLPDSSFKTLAGVRGFDSFAGILQKDAIYIDIDIPEQAECLMKIIKAKSVHCAAYQTRKGYHFYFNNKVNSTDYAVTGSPVKALLACGLQGDIKNGYNNEYDALKVGDGAKNEEDKKTYHTKVLVYDSKNENGKYDVIPYWLYPTRKRKEDFFGMVDGDGRNDALYLHILELSYLELTPEQMLDCGFITNDYVFKDKLSEADIRRIFRPDAIPDPEKIFFRKSTFLPSKLGDYIIKKNHIKLIDGELNVYCNNMYVSGDHFIGNAMRAVYKDINPPRRNSVLTYLKDTIVFDTPESDAKYISFNNGILNTDNWLLGNHTPDIVIKQIIPFDYCPDAYDKLADDFLNSITCNDHDLRMVLEEAIGCGFYRSTDAQVAFLLVGKRANGKTTFFNMLNYVYGEKNVSNIGIQKFANQFKPAQLKGKIVNLGDDIPSSTLSEDARSVFKAVVGTSKINAEFKGKDSFDFKSYATHWYSCNDVPFNLMDDPSTQRRWIPMPFNADFIKGSIDYNPNMGKMIKNEASASYFIRVGIEGLKRLIANDWNFSKSEAVKDLKDQIMFDQNPFSQFYESHDRTWGNQRPTDEAYAEFCEWYKEQDKDSNLLYSLYTIRKFCKEYSKLSGLETGKIYGYISLRNPELGKAPKNRFTSQKKSKSSNEHDSLTETEEK